MMMSRWQVASLGRENLTMAAQHTRTSYLWPLARRSRSSQVEDPRGSVPKGKARLRFVRMTELSGVRESRLRSEREGLARGMLAGAGPVKTTFSTLATMPGVARARSSSRWQGEMRERRGRTMTPHTCSQTCRFASEKDSGGLLLLANSQEDGRGRDSR